MKLLCSDVLVSLDAALHGELPCLRTSVLIYADRFYDRDKSIQYSSVFPWNEFKWCSFFNWSEHTCCLPLVEDFLLLSVSSLRISRLVIVAHIYW